MTSIEKKSCLSPDGVMIVYSSAGDSEPGLVFIHGGLANRSFWCEQLKTFSASHRVLAPDLAGHGQSGLNRRKWGLPEFGADVAAVVKAEKLKRVVLIGNSLGGPMAIEAALLFPKQIMGVIGVDTFQSLDYAITAEEARQRAEAFQADYAGCVKAMTKSLFHPDADPSIIADAAAGMARTSPKTAYAMFISLAGYNPAESARRLSVPLRAINGDMYPTDLAAVRKIKPDFDAVIMQHMGHYPMLERPDEFNQHLAKIIADLSK